MAHEYTVEYGTRSRGNRWETFETLEEAREFAASKVQSSDFVTITDADGNEVE